VIPRCAIKSIKHAPALHGEVCKRCNNLLGHVDSIAAPLTLTAVITALDGFNTRFSGMEDFGVPHYCIRLRANEMKLLNGARCFVSSTAATGYTIHLESRIALLKHDHGFDLVHPQRLGRLGPSSNERTLYTGEGIFVGFENASSLQTDLYAPVKLRMLSELEKRWAIATVRDGFEDQLGRAVAKMSFNFLAWIAGRRKYHRHGVDLYGAKFDDLRAAICRKSAPSKPFAKRVPGVERKGVLQHSIRLHVENGQLLAHINLFDMAAWQVILADAIAESDFPYDLQYHWDFSIGGCSWKKHA
jgi:hypothetical protein